MSEAEGFAVWLTGLPASGKSSIARELTKQLRARGVPVVVLESDEMRKILTPAPTYLEDERDLFYRTLAQIGEVVCRNGINVVFDATANKRDYRDRGRKIIKKFVEAYVACPLEVCRKRDPKGIYARAAHDKTATVPGVQTVYEPPVKPDVTIDGQAPPETGAASILGNLMKLRYI